MSASKYAAIVLCGGLLLFVCAIVFEAFNRPTAATGFTVCDDGSCPYMSIQAAVNAAAEGSTIMVAPGTYIEAVTIRKSLTISGSLGVTVTGISDQPAFSLKAPSITVDGLTVGPGAFVPGSVGIAVASYSDIAITNMVFRNLQTTIDATNAPNLRTEGNVTIDPPAPAPVPPDAPQPSPTAPAVVKAAEQGTTTTSTPPAPTAQLPAVLPRTGPDSRPLIALLMFGSLVCSAITNRLVRQHKQG